MKKQLMTRAWEIAKTAAVQYNASSKLFIAEAMRQAWLESRDSEITITITNDSYNGKRYSRPWAAVLTNNGSGYYDYNFVNFFGRDGAEGTRVLVVKPGQLIAIGQKDIRGGKTSNNWFQVNATKSMTIKDDDMKYSEYFTQAK